MSSKELDRFIADAQSDPKMQTAVTGKLLDAQGLVALAQAHGYGFTTADVDAHVSGQSRQLSEEELDSATGGAGQQVIMSSPIAVFVILR